MNVPLDIVSSSALRSAVSGVHVYTWVGGGMKSVFSLQYAFDTKLHLTHCKSVTTKLLIIALHSITADNNQDCLPIDMF